MEVLQPDILDLTASVDPTGIVDVRCPIPNRPHRLVTCRSGRKHLVRFGEGPPTLLRDHWGYETMHRLGIPCPRIERWIDPGSRFPGG